MSDNNQSNPQSNLDLNAQNTADKFLNQALADLQLSLFNNYELTESQREQIKQTISAAIKSSQNSGQAKTQIITILQANLPGLDFSSTMTEAKNRVLQYLDSTLEAYYAKSNISTQQAPQQPLDSTITLADAGVPIAVIQGLQQSLHEHQESEQINQQRLQQLRERHQQRAKQYGVQLQKAAQYFVNQVSETTTLSQEEQNTLLIGVQQIFSTPNQTFDNTRSAISDLLLDTLPASAVKNNSSTNQQIINHIEESASKAVRINLELNTDNSIYQLIQTITDAAEPQYQSSLLQAAEQVIYSSDTVRENNRAYFVQDKLRESYKTVTGQDLPPDKAQELHQKAIEFADNTVNLDSSRETEYQYTASTFITQKTAEALQKAIAYSTELANNENLVRGQAGIENLEIPEEYSDTKLIHIVEDAVKIASQKANTPQYASKNPTQLNDLFEAEITRYVVETLSANSDLKNKYTHQTTTSQTASALTEPLQNILQVAVGSATNSALELQELTGISTSYQQTRTAGIFASPAFNFNSAPTNYQAENLEVNYIKPLTEPESLATPTLADSHVLASTVNSLVESAAESHKVVQPTETQKKALAKFQGEQEKLQISLQQARASQDSDEIDRINEQLKVLQSTFIAENKALLDTYLLAKGNLLAANLRRQIDMAKRNPEPIPISPETIDAVTEYSSQRQELLSAYQQEIEDGKKYGFKPTRIKKLESQILELDRDFISSNQSAVNEYFQATTLEKAVAAQNERYNYNQSLLKELFTDTATTTTQRRSELLDNLGIKDPGLKEKIKTTADAVATGLINSDQAEKQITYYINKQLQKSAEMIQQGMTWNAQNPDQYSNYQKQINAGAKLVERFIADTATEAVGNAYYAVYGIKKPEDETNTYIDIKGIKQYEKLYAQVWDKVHNPDPTQRITPEQAEQELAKKIHQSLPRAIGEQVLKGKNPNFGKIGDLNQFITSTTKQILSLYDVNDPNSQIAEINRIVIEEFTAAFPLSDKLPSNLRTLIITDLQNQVTQNAQRKIVADQQYQTALTTAKIAPYIEPLLELNEKSTVLPFTFEPALKPYYISPSSAPRKTQSETIEDSYRDDYVVIFKRMLQQAGVADHITDADPIKQQQLREDFIDTTAKEAVTAALGVRTLVLDENGNVEWLLFTGALATPLSDTPDYNWGYKLMLAYMNPQERAEWAKKNPSGDELRLRALINEALKTLTEQGIDINKEFSPSETDIILGKEKVTLKEFVTSIFNSHHRDEILKMMQRIQEENKPDPTISLYHSVRTAPFVVKFSEIMASNYIENKLQKTVLAPFSKPMEYIQSLMPLNREQRWEFLKGAVLDVVSTEKQYNSQKRSFMRIHRLYSKVDEIERFITGVGPLPSGLTMQQRRELKNLKALHDLVLKANQFRSKLPFQAVRLIDKWAALNNRDTVKIIKTIFKSKNPLAVSSRMIVNAGLNHGLTRAFPNYFIYVDEYKSVIFKPWFDFTSNIQYKFKRERQKTWIAIKNTKVGKAISGAFASVKRKIITSASSAVTGFAATKIGGIIIGLAVKAIPIIGQIIGILLTVLNLPFIRDFVKMFKVLTIAAFYLIWGALYWLVSGVLGFVINTVGWLFSNTVGLLFGSVGGSAIAGGALSTFTVAGGSSGFSIFLGKLAGGFLNGISGGITLFTKLFGSMGIAGGLLIQIFTAIGAPALIIIGIIATVFTLSKGQNEYIMTALKDPVTELAGNPLAYTSPLKITKIATPNELPTSEGSRETKFTINVSSPPCSETLTIRDTIPENMEYVAGSAYTIPNATEINQNPTGLLRSVTINDTTREIIWTFSLDPSKVSQTGCSGSGFNEDLENYAVLGNAETSINAIEQMLSGHRMAGRQNAEAIYNAAARYSINPLLVIGIYYFESQLGDTGIGRPTGATGGCYNPGGQRGSGCQSAENGEFKMYTNYIEPIDDTFRNLRENYFNLGLNTVETIINKYTPVSDNNLENNPNSKRVVRCTLAYKTPCRSDVGGTNYQGNLVEVEVGFNARVLDSFTQGCLTNTAIALSDPLTNTASAIVSVGGAECAGSGVFCQAPPGDTNQLITTLNTANIWPTNSTRYPPRDGGWTRNQYELLWRLTCRITQSPTFMTAALGNDGFEVQRVSQPTEHRAYFRGLNRPDDNEIPGKRLLLITDGIIDQTDGLFIHLVAHEMGHSAQYAGGQFGTNPIYINFRDNVHRCDVNISNYPTTYPTCAERAPENHAESIGFYLTNGENFSQYWGYDQVANGGDFRQEAQTPGWLQNYYKHLKIEYFDNKEFDNNLP